MNLRKFTFADSLQINIFHKNLFCKGIGITINVPLICKCKIPILFLRIACYCYNCKR